MAPSCDCTMCYSSTLRRIACACAHTATTPPPQGLAPPAFGGPAIIDLNRGRIDAPQAVLRHLAAPWARALISKLEAPLGRAAARGVLSGDDLLQVQVIFICCHTVTPSHHHTATPSLQVQSLFIESPYHHTVTPSHHHTVTAGPIAIH